MPHRAFALFIMPSLLAMLLFIAAPLVSVIVQSLYVEHPQVMRTVEACDPFGCKTQTRVDTAAMAELNATQPLGRFNGLQTYLNAAHLAWDDLRAIWATAPDWGSFFSRVWGLQFYKALTFTLVFTAVVTPLTLVLGFVMALAVSVLPRVTRGGVIYLTLLPMIVPPVIGALTLFWMIDQRGMIGVFLKWLTGDPTLSLKASLPLAWTTIIAHGTWSSVPFVFIVFYAALQTVPRDTIESAMIDGATRFQRLRLVTLPHVAPVGVFLTLILIMDNFRVLDSIIGLSAQAHASSLSTLIYDALRGDVPLFGSAAATSVLTIACIFVLLTPSMRNAWTTFKTKA